MFRIVFFSHTARTGTFRVGSHHLSAAMAASGHAVAHISTPYSLLHSVARRDQQERRRASIAGVMEVDGVADLIPRPMLPADAVWTKRQSLRALREVDMIAPDFVFVDQPMFPPRHFPSATVVFRPTDIFAAKAHQRLAQRAAKTADAVAATSPGVLASVRPSRSLPTRVFENGVEFDRFAEARESRTEYDFVYVGALDHRFDFVALASAARRLPRHSFAIFGPHHSMPGIETMPRNIVLGGPIPYEKVPAALALGRFGIMPFTPLPSNAARSPMKLYEYIAAGLPVILPSQISERAPTMSGVTDYDSRNPDNFGKALEHAVHRGLCLSESDVEVARTRDWASISRELLDFAESVRASRH